MFSTNIVCVKEKDKVNQLDAGNKKDQQNSGTCSNNPRISKNSKNKTKWPTFGASDKNHSAPRIRKQENSNNKTKWLTFWVDNRLLFLKENNNKILK